MTKVTQTKLTRALLETADDMERIGVLPKAAHEKIGKRHRKPKAVAAASVSARKRALHKAQA